MTRAYVILFFLLIHSSSLMPQVRIDEATLKLWTVGTIGNFALENAHEIVSRNWPFETVSVAGDVIDDLTFSEIEAHNQMIWNLLELQGQKNPREKYYEQLKLEHQKINQVLKIADSIKRIQSLIQNLNGKDKAYYTKLDKVDNHNYKLSFYSYDMHNSHSESKLELDLFVNPIKKYFQIQGG